MQKLEFTIRPINPQEIEKVAALLSTGYYHDDFFKWSVESDDERHKIVADYYSIYLKAVGCVAHVAETPDGSIIGATVWLPHDVDTSIYDEIDKAAGIYAPQFRAVCDNSHYSEPPMEPFYQLVGFVVLPKAQGMGIGGALLKYHLDILDKVGIPTYLEASTPYFGGGVYGRFGYQPVGELMVFAETAVLYPLWRPAAPPQEKLCQKANHHPELRRLQFGNYNWLVLAERGNKILLLSENIISLQKYHDTFESVTWANSTARKYLNDTFYNTFKPEDQSRIVETELYDQNTTDKIFLLSVEEVVTYLGNSGEPNSNKFYIDDKLNSARKAVYTDSSPCRWSLRTSGNLPYLVATVTVEGKVAITGDFVNRPSSNLFNVGLRPAMWVEKP